MKFLRTLLLLSFSIPAFSATTYTIQALVDNSQPGATFYPSTPSFGVSAVNNTPYLGGIIAGGSAAIGTLTGNTFNILTLPPLPGGDYATIGSTLKDGSAVGVTNTYIPNPANPNFPPLEVARLTRWNNGVASEITIADPNDANAVFPPAPIAFNSEGDIVGQHISNGVLSAFKYNVFDQTFEVIPLPNSNIFQLVVSSVNEDGKILAIANGPTSSQILYDPATGSWKEIPFPPGLGTGGKLFLNSIGQFVATYVDFSTFSYLPYIFNGVDLMPIYNGAGPLLPFVSFSGFNRHGEALGTADTRVGIYANGRFEELFPKITNSSGWDTFNSLITGLSGINDQGQIFGIGRYNGAETAFVLNPNNSSEVPEPSSVVITLSALAVFARVHAKRIRRSA